MTDLSTAAQQALEALKVATTPLAKDRQEVLRAVAALKAALTQQDEPVWMHPWPPVRAQQAEPVEPVAYGWVGDPSTQDYASTQPDPVQPVGAAGLFTLAHLWAQQCYFKGLGRPCDIDSARGAFEQALKAYTSPPQRKPLTQEEIAAEWRKASECAGKSEGAVTTSQFVEMFARAVERAHGIKE